ncbi:hypothetical protein SAMN05216499_1644 [Actinacidiphila paucisporea]|uniref:Uncharacterized protein n=1 Tax=Actinacidiphila paucisporea TaxID=310782 RepID=A0A1M7R178_9ACTN|nr:hypothetical protein SAMN05216499_1644 [Actinacidiphila paucisporea]
MKGSDLYTECRRVKVTAGPLERCGFVRYLVLFGMLVLPLASLVSATVIVLRAIDRAPAAQLADVLRALAELIRPFFRFRSRR